MGDSWAEGREKWESMGLNKETSGDKAKTVVYSKSSRAGESCMEREREEVGVGQGPGLADHAYIWREGTQG